MEEKILRLSADAAKSVEIFGKKHAEPDFVLPGLVAGAVGVLTGYDRTFWALEAAMAVACKTKGGDLLGIKPKSNGKVVYYNSIYPAYTLDERLYLIEQHIKDKEAKASIASNMTVLNGYGCKIDLMHDKDIQNIVLAYKGYRLIVFDTLPYTVSDANTGDIAKQAHVLRYIAAKTGAAVLYTTHDESGLIAFARWHGKMEKAGKHVHLSISDKDRHDYTYNREQGGVLIPLEK